MMRRKWELVRLTLFLMLILSLTVFAQAQSNRDGRTGLGKGLFVTPPGNNPDYDFSDTIDDDPLIAGYQMQWAWSDFEPEDDEFDWSQVEFVLDQAVANNMLSSFSSQQVKKAAVKRMIMSGSTTVHRIGSGTFQMLSM